VVAGKEVDVSIWDLERVFAKGPVPIGEKAAGKRKKGELEDGEVWRAKNVSRGSDSSAFPSISRRV
jgi:ribosome biogenesis protein NSA1